MSESVRPSKRRGVGRYKPGDMPPAYGDTASVLIVDDDPQVTIALVHILERDGYRCTVANSAPEARAWVGKREFALALIDVMMPGESGLELAAELLETYPDLGVVMVTGIDDPAIAELALEAGAYGYVPKPFLRNELLITVANAGRRRCLEIDRRLYEQQLRDQVEALAPSPDAARWRMPPPASALLDAVPDAILSVDGSGVIITANRRAEELLRYPHRALPGESLADVVPGAVHLLSHTRADHRTTEVTAHRRDGDEFIAELSTSVVDDPAGDRQLVVVLRDVRDRSTDEMKFRGLVETAPDAIVAVDEDGRIVIVNAQAERLFGYTREELIGGPLEPLVPEAKRAVHPRHRREYFANPHPRPMGAGMQLAGRRKDGTEFPAEISLSALETEHGIIVSAAVRDVSERLEAHAERERFRAQAERERLERQLQQSQRLESLGQLAGGVAHDFNNLLAVIMNYTAFVGEEVTSASADDPDRWQPVVDDVGEVQRAAQRAAELTRQLLAFGRREVVKPKVLRLNEIVEGVEQLLHRTIGEHVQLTTHLDPELWPIVADRGQLEQVLVNLAVNARDAMPDGGTLTIDTANVKVDEAYAEMRPGLRAGRHVRMRLSDTGKGMAKDIVARAFEPFFTTKPKGEGTGLGLATCYGIITQADGFAQIYSEPGFGTTFIAYFPATDQPLAGDDESLDERDPTGDETVLVVEDESAMREVARRILSRNGYEVLVAGGGKEALEIAAVPGLRIDLLLTDVIMPRMLGKEVAERVTELQPDARVLFMSGYAEPVLTSRGTLADDVALIEKPFSEQSLLRRVRDLLDG